MFAYALSKEHAVENLMESAGRVLRIAGAALRGAACAAGGHDYLRQRAGNRLFLRCADCGHETPGWRLDAPTAWRPKPTPAALRPDDAR